MKSLQKKNQAHFIDSKSNLSDWPREKTVQAHSHQPSTRDHIDRSFEFQSPSSLSAAPSYDNVQQIHNCYIVLQNDAGFILIHQQNAHERILYERFINALKGKPIATQRSLFPVSIELSVSDAVIMNELLEDLHLLGYALEPFGKNTFVIQGVPADVPQGNEKVTIEKMLDQYNHFSNDLKFSKREKLFRSMAWQQSVKAGVCLSQKEIKYIVEDLFKCEKPNITPNGKPVYLEFKKTEIDAMFGR